MSVEYSYCKTAIFKCDTPDCIDVNGDQRWIFTFGKQENRPFEVARNKGWFLQGKAVSRRGYGVGNWKRIPQYGS